MMAQDTSESGDALPVWNPPPRKRGVRFLWQGVRKLITVSIVPLIPCNALRILMYRFVGFRIGKRVYIGMMSYLDDLYPELLVIEDDVTVSYRTTFACHGPGAFDRTTVLRKGCYIGMSSTIVGPVEIGEGAMIGAGAVVVKDIPPMALAVGVPAKVIKQGQLDQRRR